MMKVPGRLHVTIAVIRPEIGPTFVALLVILAGCSTLVPSPPTAGDGSSDSPAPTEFPPGTDASGIADTATVIETHQSLLANQSYAIQASQGTDEGESSLDISIESNPEERRAHATASGAGPLGGTELYLTDDAVYIKRGTGSTTEYQRQDPDVPFPVQHRRQLGTGYLEAILSAGVYERSGHTTVGTTPVWEFSLVESHTNQTRFANVTSVDGTILIDERGIIWRAALEFTADGTPGGPVTTRIEYRVDAVGGVSVPEPSWVAEATSGTGNHS